MIYSTSTLVELQVYKKYTLAHTCISKLSKSGGELSQPKASSFSLHNKISIQSEIYFN